MAWSLYRWVWLLESPLHIGIPPAGMLNRTRLYVPARTLWGALTAELARSQVTAFPDYKQVGERIKQETRLSYLYPAEAVNGEWKAWLPRYQEGKGLVWEREDGNTEEERKFRMRILTTRPGTAIDPESDTAAEGNLRESEVISPYWQNGENSLKPVRLLGYLFCKDDGRKSEQIQKLQQIQTILLGGDARYGLGKIRWVECKEVTCFFGCPVELNQADPVVQRSRVLAHVPANSVQLQGEYELLAGWDDRNLQSSTQLYWQPGAVSTEPLRWKILDDGYWEKTKQ